ncbi:MAG: SipW-dependent-type signal peptide-containing protein [Clostridiales bacterium]|nr:SipW-dependent-type signal peptide-containing protein [Clostridiales bacterium]
MSKKKVILAIIILLLVLIVGKSLAYFTDTKSKNHSFNTFTVGNVQITLTTPNFNKSEHTHAELGEHIPYDPTITVIGSEKAYLFAIVENPIIQEGEDIIKYDVNDGWQQISQYYEGKTKFVLYAFKENSVLKKVSRRDQTTIFDNIVYINNTTGTDAEGEYILIDNFGIKVSAYAIEAKAVDENNTIADTWNLIVNQYSDNQNLSKFKFE